MFTPLKKHAEKVGREDCPVRDRTRRGPFLCLAVISNRIQLLLACAFSTVFTRRHLYGKHAIVVFTALSLGLLGCATFEKEKTLSEEELYRKGIKEFEEKDYRKAAEIFKNILDEFPDSKIRPLSVIALARSQYQNGEYENAKFHFERFIEQYPAHAQVVKAYYFKAMCSFELMESYKRDQTNTHLALEGFEKVINTFPDGKYVRLARQKKAICRRQLARNILYIGHYYFGVGAYQSVINRMDELLKNYPEQKFLDEAFFLLGESYLKEGNRKNAYIAFKNLIQKFPKSSYKADARNRLAFLKKR
jgi:outer membrane protein assembly factor BamD